MSDQNETPPPYHYVAYIDEAGDPGIERVRPIDEPGGTEWLVIGAILIQAMNELAPVEWVRSTLELSGSRQRHLHFRELTEWQKPLVCQNLATFPLRTFTLLSNKKNMRGYKNERAAARGSPLTTKQVFYNYCLRLLLERITDYCLRHSMHAHGKPRYVKLIFSKRGGHSYGHTIAYNEILKNQSRSQTTYLDKRTIKWEVVDRRLQEEWPHESVAGLQLADVVASSFFQAVDILPPTNWNPENAKLLWPVVGTEGGFRHDYGVALQPTPYCRAKLMPRQRKIFEFYNFDMRDF